MITEFEDYLSRFPVAVNGLVNAVTGRRSAHAYLITGDKRSTLDGFEKILSLLVSCPEVLRSGRPCGCCRSCTARLLGNSPDNIELKPSGRAYMIRIGESNDPEPNTVRWFINKLALSASEAGAVKTGIIRDVDRLNTEAQNALLKTLEEPPKDTVLILSSMHPEKLLPTTRSRCQVIPALENCVDFQFPEAAELRKYLYRIFTLKPGDVAGGAAVCSDIMELTSSLLAGEQERLAEENRRNIELARENDPALAKRLAAASEDMAVGEYRGKRSRLLGLIYSFFAALAVRAEGLDNPDESSESLLAGFVFGKIDPAAAERALAASEELAVVLNYNISESIAWYNWMLKIVNPAVKG